MQVDNKFTIQQKKLESIPQTGWKRYQRQDVINNSRREYREQYPRRIM
jgi:hypothetical protein